ncbi:piRNA biogenesis protein EXD1, partial [Dendrobates tinctorius]|uniref:piRNA biogenesis protein EXD1 n=1 Tax=Dendrobates tinctorius TaxID=92724 RepID=UPI003CC947CE
MLKSAMRQRRRAVCEDLEEVAEGSEGMSSSFNMDPVTDTDFLSRFIGTNIKITTIHGCFQGELFHIDAARAIILVKVKDLSTGKTSPGAKLFFGHVILKEQKTSEIQDLLQKGVLVKVPELQRVETEEDPLDRVDQEQVDDRIGDMVLEDQAKPALNPEKVEATVSQNVKERGLQIPNYSGDEDINYILIDHFQPMFGPAIMYLQNQKVLGLAAVALNMSCHGKLCWLQVATKTRVYIFDILLLGPKVFKNGLQMVLEDKGILKVVHDCRWLGNFLFHKYSVVLTNVFDTQVADVYLFSMETGGFLPNRTSSSIECLTRYLNLPSSEVSFLKYKQTIIK